MEEDKMKEAGERFVFRCKREGNVWIQANNLEEAKVEFMENPEIINRKKVYTKSKEDHSLKGGKKK